LTDFTLHPTKYLHLLKDSADPAPGTGRPPATAPPTRRPCDRLTPAPLTTTPHLLGTDQALRYAVRALVTRPRPPLTDWATHASGWAFPSGHTTTAALTAGLLIIAVRVRGPRGTTPPPWSSAAGARRSA
ncbi:hypothetical protein ACWDE9_33495, partial [Streptomyces olivaceoviridis]